MSVPIRVLRVDGGRDVAESTATVLVREADGMAVETVTNGADALDRLGDRDIDYVVSDYEVPGMDGHKLLSAVREDYPNLPFILFTGNGSEADLVCTVRDRSERRDRLAELRLKGRVLDEAPIGITIAEPGAEDNPLIYVDDEFERLTGHDAAEIIGADCRFLQGGDINEDPVAVMRAAIDTVESVTVELRDHRTARSSGTASSSRR